MYFYRTRSVIDREISRSRWGFCHRASSHRYCHAYDQNYPGRDRTIWGSPKELIQSFDGDIPSERIRNFGIIAHIDHGKSTLADRILRHTGVFEQAFSNKQSLDSLEVEINRGITVKAKTFSFTYPHENKSYLMNLIDTPGHVDFAYEVSRSVVTACDGALLLVDAIRGVEAQTVSNFELVFNSNKTIIPIINKIDAKNAKIELVKQQLCNQFGFLEKEIVMVSARMGTGVKEVLDTIVKNIPSPEASRRVKPFRCSLYDMWFDEVKGVVCAIAIEHGSLSIGDCVTSVFTEKSYTVKDLGLLSVQNIKLHSLHSGQVGYVILGMKNPQEAIIGDTLFGNKQRIEDVKTNVNLISPPKPMIYAGIYPTMPQHYDDLKSAIEKLLLNDSSVKIVAHKSDSLGFGWRAGFLGSLHMEIFQERLANEFKQNVIKTNPSVPYKAKLTNGKEVEIRSPEEFPESYLVKEFYEPHVSVTVVCPSDCYEKIEQHFRMCRGNIYEVVPMSTDTTLIKISAPMSDVIVSSFDAVKRLSSGYGSFEYEETGHFPVKLKKLDVTLNKTKVPPLSRIVLEERALTVAKSYCEALKTVIPRKQFEIDIRILVGAKTIARSIVKPLRKDVTQQLYGGDVSRKKKLLENQKESKKLLKAFGRVEVPHEAFLLSNKDF